MTPTIQKIATGLATNLAKNRTSIAIEELLSQAFLRGVALGQTIRDPSSTDKPSPSTTPAPEPPSCNATN